MLSGESLSSSLSILWGWAYQGLVPPMEGWCHSWEVTTVGVSPDILGLVVRRGGQCCQQVQALHLHGWCICTQGMGVMAGGDRRWQGLCATPVPARLTFLAVGLAGWVGVLGLLPQLFRGRDTVHHLLLHGGRGCGGQRGGWRGWVAEVVLRGDGGVRTAGWSRTPR